MTFPKTGALPDFCKRKNTRPRKTIRTPITPASTGAVKKASFLYTISPVNTIDKISYIITKITPRAFPPPDLRFLEDDLDKFLVSER